MNGEEMFDRLVNRLIQSETRLAQVRQSNKAALAQVNELERQIEDDARVRDLEKRLSASCDDAAKWRAEAGRLHAELAIFGSSGKIVGEGR